MQKSVTLAEMMAFNSDQWWRRTKLGLVGENEVSCQHGSLWNLLLDGKWPDLDLSGKPPKQFQGAL